MSAVSTKIFQHKIWDFHGVYVKNEEEKSLFAIY